MVTVFVPMETSPRWLWFVSATSLKVALFSDNDSLRCLFWVLEWKGCVRIEIFFPMFLFRFLSENLILLSSWNAGSDECFLVK